MQAAEIGLICDPDILRGGLCHADMDEYCVRGNPHLNGMALHPAGIKENDKLDMCSTCSDHLGKDSSSICFS